MIIVEVVILNEHKDLITAKEITNDLSNRNWSHHISMATARRIINSVGNITKLKSSHSKKPVKAIPLADYFEYVQVNYDKTASEGIFVRSLIKNSNLNHYSKFKLIRMIFRQSDKIKKLQEQNSIKQMELKLYWGEYKHTLSKFKAEALKTSIMNAKVHEKLGETDEKYVNTLSNLENYHSHSKKLESHIKHELI